jgi:hypothetical protein
MSNSADPVVGIAQVLSVFVGAGTAAAVAPHLVVLIAGLAGGVLGLMSWRQCSTREAVLYVLGMGALAWLMAGTAAELAGMLWARLDDKRLLTPAALSIGWVGHRWPAVGRWAGRLIKGSAEAALRGGGKP